MRSINSKMLKNLSLIGLILVFASVDWAQKPSLETIKTEAADYLQAHESQLRETTVPREQFKLLIYLAPAALAAGYTEKAQSYAQELLTVGKKLKSRPGFGESYNGFAIHISNIIFGRIALDAGRTEEAKQYLLTAGQLTGHPPTLVSFGPDMILAKQLIEKGESETAIQYFDLCAKFWTAENGKLEKWKKTVKEGGIPDFGFKTSPLNAWRGAE